MKKVPTCLFFRHCLGRLYVYVVFCHYFTPRLSHQIGFKLQMTRQENTGFTDTLGLHMHAVC